MTGSGIQSLQAAMAGERGMQISMEAAEKATPGFSERAREAILAHLRVVGQASGEELTAIARAHAPCRDGRALGSIFRSLARQGLIRCLRSDLPRANGNGTSGGRLWGLCDGGLQ